MLVVLSIFIVFLFSVFNIFFFEFWYSCGFELYVYYEVVVVIIVFVLIGKLMEECVKGNIFIVICKLMGFQFCVVWVFCEGIEEDILIDQL